MSFAPPVPGQHREDHRGRDVVGVDVTVEVAAGACEDVVGFSVCRSALPAADASPGALQADYLGWVLARTPCA